MTIHDLEPGQAMMVDWTVEEYFADTQCVSRSELWMLSKDPPLYHAVVVEKSMPWPGSKEMELGTLIHLAVLEREVFMDTVKIRPDKPETPRPKSTMLSDAAKFDLCAPDPWAIYDAQCRVLDAYEQSGGTVISQAQAKLVTDIATKVATHGFASDLLELSGVNEQTIIWREPTTGLLCRARLDSLRYLPADQPWDDEAALEVFTREVDRLAEIDGAVVITDLKSTRDPEPEAFGRTIKKLGYDFQAGFYTDAVRACFPGLEVIYAIIAAGTERPLKASAAPLALRAIDEGRRKYKAALADLVKRRETNNWRASWEEDRDLVFDMPRWAYPKDDGR